MKQILTPRGWRPINESVDNRFIAKPRNKKDHAKQSNWHHGEAQRLEDQAAHFDKADHYGDNIVKRNYENLSAELRRQAAFHRKQADHHERQMSGKLLEGSVSRTTPPREPINKTPRTTSTTEFDTSEPLRKARISDHNSPVPKGRRPSPSTHDQFPNRLQDKTKPSGDSNYSKVDHTRINEASHANLSDHHSDEADKFWDHSDLVHDSNPAESEEAAKLGREHSMRAQRHYKVARGYTNVAPSGNPPPDFAEWKKGKKK